MGVTEAGTPALEEETVVAIDVQTHQPFSELRNRDEGESNVVALDGYLGTSTDGGWRLYRDLSLSYWLEINEEDIRDAETVPLEGVPLRLTVLWIERGATLTAKTSPPDTDLSDFLRNPFTPEDLVMVESETWGAWMGPTKIHRRSHCYS